jgi:hypothetical protein
MPISLEELASYVEDKSVAIVGNAQSLFTGITYGSYIDMHDVVLRFNKGEIVSDAHQGTKTDILSLACKLPEKMYHRFNPKYVIWATPKREDGLGFEKVKDLPNLFVAPDDAWEKLFEDLKKNRPSSGMIVLNLFVSLMSPRVVSVFGFDSFATRSFYRGPGCGPHSTYHERRLLEDWERFGEIYLYMGGPP